MTELIVFVYKPYPQVFSNKIITNLCNKVIKKDLLVKKTSKMNTNPLLPIIKNQFSNFN